MDLRITLAPDGGLRLILPTGRPLDVGTTASALHFIRRILMDVRQGKREQRGYVGEFPTQHVIDIWRKQDEEAKAEARAARAAAAEAKAIEEAETVKAALKEKGIDLEELDFQL